MRLCGRHVLFPTRGDDLDGELFGIERPDFREPGADAANLSGIGGDELIVAELGNAQRSGVAQQDVVCSRMGFSSACERCSGGELDAAGGVQGVPNGVIPLPDAEAAGRE